MKVGNVSQTVLKRSILKTIRTTRDEVLFAPSVEEMCAAIHMEEGQGAIFTSASVSGNDKAVGKYALLKAVNDLATRGARPVAAGVQLILPPFAYESRIKSMIEHMEKVCQNVKVQIAAVKAEVSVAVNQAVVCVTVMGDVPVGKIRRSNTARPGQEIVMTGYAGLEGMLRIVGEKREELSKRFVPAFMHQVKSLETELSALAAIAAAEEYNISAMHQIGNGGIMAVLWELTDSSGVGMQIEMQKIQIKQETVEICEYFHVNPYQMTSAGAILMVTDTADALVDELGARGLRAVKLGITTDEAARVILSGQEREKRFLDRPQPDELMLWWERMTNQIQED